MTFTKWAELMRRSPADEGAGTVAATAETEAVTSPQTEQGGTTAAAGTGEAVVLGGGKPEATAPASTEAPKEGEEAAKTEPAKADGEPDPMSLVPEDGVYALTLPEGVEMDAQLAEAVFPAFKDIGLNIGQANKLAAAFATYREKEAEQGAVQWEARNRDWQGQAKADKTYADVGYDNAVVAANKAVDKFGDAELIDALRTSGMGNHPALIRFAYRASAAMADDKTERGGNAAAATTTKEQRMYGSTTPTSKKG